MSSETTKVNCPSCGAETQGKFCSNCGAPVAGAPCSHCGATLTPGAKFCHECGSPVGTAALASATRERPTALPWAVAGVALAALIALVAGQRLADRRTTTVDEAGGEPLAAADAAAPAPRAPDISSLSPRERADRLYDRVMRLDSEGKTDSVRFFSEMAITAYQMLPEQDADSRYDMGRIAAVSGAWPVARAQADTILATQPTNLLGLSLAAEAARATGDRAAASGYARRLVAAAPSESARNLPGYQRHAAELQQAIADARQ